jgi:Xaa-Pro dipeptidase
MTVGVGGSTAEAELAAIKNMRGDVPPIGVDERRQRIARAQAIMREKGIDALYLDVSSSMTYFTGLKFRRTERMHSAVLPARGEIVYISPAFEVEKLKTMISFGDKIAVWEEDEDPTATVTETVRALGYPSGTIAVDEATPFFTFDGLRRAGNAYTFISSIDVTAGCRMIKSEQELALMQTAKNITLEAHKAAAHSCAKASPRQKCRPSSPPRTASSARKAIHLSTRCCSARRPRIRTAYPIRRRSRTAT